MQKIIGVLFAVLFVLSFAAVCRGEATETAVENGQLVVRTVAKTETERYDMPPVSVLNKDIPAVLSIMRAREGEYEVKQSEERRVEWSFPMRSTTRAVNIAATYDNGKWLQPFTVVKPWRPMQDNWLLTGLLLAIAIGMVWVSVVHQKSGNSEWYLLVFYGSVALTNIAVVMGEVGIAAIGCFIIVASIMLINDMAICNSDFVVSIAAAVIYAIAIFVASATIKSPPMESAGFWAGTIAGSYLLAKIAKRLGWIKPRLPVGSAS